MALSIDTAEEKKHSHKMIGSVLFTGIPGIKKEKTGGKTKTKDWLYIHFCFWG